LPLFNALSDYLPDMMPALEAAKNSKSLWEAYEETEQDKLVYTKKVSTKDPSDASLESLPEENSGEEEKSP